MEIFHSMSEPIVFFLSYNAFGLSNFRHACCVYDYIDELAVFPGSRKTLEQNHRTLLKTATLVVATAERLWQQVKIHRPDALLCPNGVDYCFIRQVVESTSQPPSDLISLLRPAAPVIGYYGALAEWFDYGLLRRIATARPEYEFVLIGPDYDASLRRSQILSVSNIHWLGVRPYAQLPQYLKYFDVATIPFRLNEITHSTSPVKLFEYMAARKPVVTTAMHESCRYAGVVIAEGVENFARKLDEALQLRTDPEYMCLIDLLAQENTWDVRVQQILEALSPANGRVHEHLQT
jgi:glycosyltransferase involved in cell wall biosynthesis